jgi:hypothetical protein
VQEDDRPRSRNAALWNVVASVSSRNSILSRPMHIPAIVRRASRSRGSGMREKVPKVSSCVPRGILRSYAKDGAVDGETQA